MPNFAALRAAVFPLSTKNLRGGGYPPPPVGARVNLSKRAYASVCHMHGYLSRNVLSNKLVDDNVARWRRPGLGPESAGSAHGAAQTAWREKLMGGGNGELVAFWLS